MLRQSLYCSKMRYHGLGWGHCKKKLMENSASLTRCNRLTCKGDWKLFQHEDRVYLTSSDDEDRIFRNHWNFPTVFCSPAKEFSDNFPSTFWRMNHQKQHQRDSIPHPSGLQSTTLPLRHTLLMGSCVTALSFPFSVLVSTCLPLSVLCCPSSVMC